MSYDFSKPSVLHLGDLSLKNIAVLAIALTYAFSGPAHAQLKYDPGVSVVAANTQQEQPDDAIRDILSRNGLSVKNADLSENREMAKQKRQEEKNKIFVADVEAAARDVGIGTCFRGFLNDFKIAPDQRKNIEKSVTTLIARNKKTKQFLGLGSGFIAENSGTPENSLNKIITAQHVISAADMNQNNTSVLIETKMKELHPNLSFHDAIIKEFGNSTTIDVQKFFKEYAIIKDNLLTQADISIEAWSSEGKFLGLFEPIATAGPLNRPIEVMEYVKGMPDVIRDVFKNPKGNALDEIGSSATRYNNDWAVLKAVSVSPEYTMALGLPLAPVQYLEKTHGWSGGAIEYGQKMLPAVKPGFSGGPVIRDDGYVYGVASSVIYIPSTETDNEKLIYGMQSSTVNPVTSNHRLTPMNKHQILAVNPLGDSRLLSAIGKAGQGVTTSMNAPLRTSTKISMVVGFPMGYCAASPTMQGPIGEKPRELPSAPQPNNPRIPGMTEVPRPDSTFIASNGDRYFFNQQAEISSVKKKNGEEWTYENGEKIRVDRPDGSSTEYVNNIISRTTTADGTIFGYDIVGTGKNAHNVAVVKIDPDGTVFPLLPQGKQHPIYRETNKNNFKP